MKLTTVSLSVPLGALAAPTALGWGYHGGGFSGGSYNGAWGGSFSHSDGSGSATGARGSTASDGGGSWSASGFRGGSASGGGGSWSGTGWRGGTASGGGGSWSAHGAYGGYGSPPGAYGPPPGAYAPQNQYVAPPPSAGRAGTQLITNGPQTNPGDISPSRSAQRNVVESESYERLLKGNPAFRQAHMRKECGPITDPQLHRQCLDSFAQH